MGDISAVCWLITLLLSDLQAKHVQQQTQTQQKKQAQDSTHTVGKQQVTYATAPNRDIKLFEQQRHTVPCACGPCLRVLLQHVVSAVMACLLVSCAAASHQAVATA
jgi:hypothetical protein